MLKKNNNNKSKISIKSIKILCIEIILFMKSITIIKNIFAFLIKRMAGNYFF
jgi:hypothetical protein